MALRHLVSTPATVEDKEICSYKRFLNYNLHLSLIVKQQWEAKEKTSIEFFWGVQNTFVT